MTYREDLWEIAVEHHGVVTTWQAKEAGIPAVELRKLAARGALEHLGRGVYRHRQVPFTHYTSLMAAVERIGPEAFLHGESVLAMFDLADVNPSAVQVAAPRRVRVKVPRTIAVTTRTDVANDVVNYEGVPATTVFRALIDSAPRLMSDRLTSAADQALGAGLIDSREHKSVKAVLRR